MTYKKKLIEVALPLEAINAESAREKSIRHGHPSTLHLWWARRPLATCRAVLFASLVDDPDDPEATPAFVAACRQLEKGKNAQDHDTPRQRLFDFIEKLVKWENSNNEQILSVARELINLACDGNPPPVLDPFCGGGSIPLEAQRLGLKAYASDLNPVAVLITKALIEIPPKFAGQPPVNPEWQRKSANEKAAKLWRGTEGLAEDVRYYGKWMRDEAEKRIGKYYPKAKLPDGREATVIAWLWARTVKCPNPACGCQMPLISNLQLSKKQGKEAWVEPIVQAGSPPTVKFEVHTGKGTVPAAPKQGKGGRFKCVACGTITEAAYVRQQAASQGFGQQMMAIVAEGDRGRVYLPPTAEQENLALTVSAPWRPDAQMPDNPRWFSPPLYGLTNFGDLFTDRQLLALTTLSDLVGEARTLVQANAIAAGMANDGTDAQPYANAVGTYLAFLVDQQSNQSSSVCGWNNINQQMIVAFSRQAIPMTWDYAECNVFSTSSGSYNNLHERLIKGLGSLPTSASQGVIDQADAATTMLLKSCMLSSDPPYYDNIGYSDLSDFFYSWLQHSLRDIYPELLSTILTPKNDELIASPYRFGGSREKAKQFFEIGLRNTFKLMRNVQQPEYPFTLFYAFKQSDSESEDDTSDALKLSSTGWETMLGSLLQSGFQVTGTWPMKTESANKLKAMVNALASSIVLVCRPRPDDAPVTTRRDLTRQLEAELPQALRELLDANIAPVDLAQAAIGPGMAVYSRYSKVLEASGEPMRVRDALVLINQLLYEHLNEGAEELDSETQFALAWFKQFQYAEGKYGEAEVLAKSKNIAVESLVGAGIAVSKAGKVRLLERGEYDHEHWDAAEDTHLNAWEVTQRMIWALENQGEQRAAQILRAVGGLGETARELSYRLYTLCDQKGWAKEALAYNTLVQSWRDIEERMRDIYGGPRQAGLDLGE